jgi:hypothetical protein
MVLSEILAITRQITSSADPPLLLSRPKHGFESRWDAILGRDLQPPTHPSPAVQL